MPPDAEVPLAEREAKSKLMYEVVVKAATFFTVLGQIRQQATDEEDARLTESIQQYGILQPLGARPDGTLTWGHRRYRCGLAARLTEFPTVILHKDMQEGDYLILQVLENIQRADLAPYDLWQGCVRLLETNKGWQLKDLAKALSLDPGTVTRIMAASKAIPAVVEAFKAGKIGTSAVYAITKGETPEEQERLLNLSLAGINRGELEKEARRNRVRPAAVAPAVKLSRVKCPLSTGVTVTVSGPEMTLSEYLEALNLAREAATKAAKESLDIKTAEKVWKDKAKAAV